jgi:MAF protein
MAPSLVLGSASPRRRELLAALGVAFTTCAAMLDEDQLLAALADLPVMARASVLAQRKAATVRAQLADPAAVVLGADTLVVLNGEVLGKPASADEAVAMLRRRRNRAHQVITGVALDGPTGSAASAVATTVFMRDYSEAEMAAYIATGDPFDKAGAYAIQHPGFQPVARIQGCYPNVVGLPLCATRDLLAGAGIPTQTAATTPWTARCTACPLRAP